MRTDLHCCFLLWTLQVYFRPDLEDMLQPVGHRLSVRVSVLMCAAADGLVYELTQGWEPSLGQSFEHAVLVLVPVSPDVCPGPGWYDVIDVICV